MPRFKWDNKSYNNPVELALDLIGGKWKMPILWRLKDRPWRYNELRRELDRITHKMLTEQLRELEYHGLVHRDVKQAVPPHVEYSLTVEGERTISVIETLRDFGKSYLDRNQKGPPGLNHGRTGTASAAEP
ncbi:MAG: MarR family transcriptional regulator [Spirochaetaceae bacterium]|nr:MarR family transcriptional regulator [Spirochaetaceae bacterium]|tara:strand:- start:37431 stop:37823 length:393 start_codon:yes stop_codon:yes gene_type:complete